MKTFDGYSKEKFSDTSVLLAGGGSKELSNFIGTLNWDSTNRKLQYKKIGDTNWSDLVTFGSNATNSTAYLPLAGGTMTGDILSTRPMKLGCNGTGAYVNYHCMYLGYHSTDDLYFYESTFHFRVNGGSTDQVTISGNNITAAGQFYANSDIRYKLIQTNLLNKVNVIAELPIFTYYWNDDKHDDNLHIGSSAQAVKEVLPELVTYDEPNDFYNLDYATLGTIAGITACKELVNQKSEIDLLKERIKELEQKLKMINDYGRC